MNTVKSILYVIILLILCYLLIKTFRMLFAEHFEETTDEQKELEKAEESLADGSPTDPNVVETDTDPNAIKNVVEQEIIPNDDEKPTDELEDPDSTNPVPYEYELPQKGEEITIKDQTNEVPTEPEYQEITEQPTEQVINAQGEVEKVEEEIKPSEAAFETQKDQVREDPIIEPKYYDAKTETILDGVKVIPHSLLSPWANAYMSQTNNYMLDTGDDLDGGSMRYTKRSPACCSPTYPPPFKVRVDPTICKDKNNYVPGPYTGSDNWSNAGCACATKKNILKLAHRGGNA